MERKNTILVIDNDKAFTSILTKYLKEICGYDVSIVPDGYNGIILAKKSVPDIILLDIRMPAMNGLGILEKLKSDTTTAHIPVIIITGFDDEDVKNKALSLKASDYIAKPLDLEFLRSRVAAALE